MDYIIKYYTWINRAPNYRTAEMSIDSLIRVLHALGYRIPVQVEPLHKAASKYFYKSSVV